MKRNIQIAFVLIVILVFVSVLSLKQNPFQGGEKELVCTAPVTKKILDSLENEYVHHNDQIRLAEQKENLNYCKNSMLPSPKIALQYAFRFDTDLMDKQDSVKVQTTVLDNCMSVWNLRGTKRGELVVKSEELRTTSQYLQFYSGIGIKPYFEVDRKTLEAVKGHRGLHEFSCVVKHVAKQRNKI